MNMVTAKTMVVPNDQHTSAGCGHLGFRLSTPPKTQGTNWKYLSTMNAARAQFLQELKNGEISTITIRSTIHLSVEWKYHGGVLLYEKTTPITKIGLLIPENGTHTHHPITEAAAHDLTDAIYVLTDTTTRTEHHITTVIEPQFRAHHFHDGSLSSVESNTRNAQYETNPRTYATKIHLLPFDVKENLMVTYEYNI